MTVRVTDDGAPSSVDFETINITVGEVNQAPVLAAIGIKHIDQGRLLTFTALATDADSPADNLSFSLDSGAPAGASIDPSTGQFSWTPSEGTLPGIHTITVRVSDDGLPSLDDFETITITVNDINLPPVLATIGGQSVEEGSPLTFTASATNPDLATENLSFSLDSGAPAGATIHPTTGEFNWTPAEAEGPAVYSVTVRVTDAGTPSLDDFETFEISVAEVNQAPVLAAIGNQSIVEGSLLTFTASANDADLPANNLTFSLDPGAPAGATIHPSTGQFSWTPPAGTLPGNHTVMIRVSDDGLPRRTAEGEVHVVYRLQDPLDINRDGRVSVLDALAIINQISRMPANEGELVAGFVDPTFYDYDANRDGNVSVLDALVVINHLSITHEAESTEARVIPALETVAPTLEGSLDDDLIRMLADDNILAGRADAFTER
jgi:hypothetical protein